MYINVINGMFTDKLTGIDWAKWGGADENVIGHWLGEAITAGMFREFQKAHIQILAWRKGWGYYAEEA